MNCYNVRNTRLYLKKSNVYLIKSLLNVYPYPCIDLPTFGK